MALLTIPSITKGTPALITLDKTILMTLLSEAGDAYYSNASHIKSAIVQYRSDSGNQIKNMQFDLSESSPSAYFYTSTVAKDIFELQKIIVTDFDGGSIQIPKSSLPSGLDIDMSGGGGQLASTLALYHFDGNANGAYGNDLTVYGSPTYVSGRFGQAASGFSTTNYFDRSGSFFNVGSGDFTMECWTKASSPTGGFETIVGINVDGSYSCAIMRINSNLHVFYNDRSIGQTQFIFYENYDVDFKHFVVQRRSGISTLFIDGVQKFTVSEAELIANGINSNLPAINTKLEIGFDPNNGPATVFQGIIDEVRISNAAMYSEAGFTPPSAPLS
jgi:hypothetical protein